MKCLLKSLLGIGATHRVKSGKNGDVCTEYHPIVKSLAGSVFFLALMIMLINLVAA